MTKEKIKVNWQKNLSFLAEVNNHKIVLDASEQVGGENKGPRPKPLLMAALAGCTGMDVVSILKKMRVELDDFNVYVEGDITEEHPKQFTSIHIVYEFKGKNLPEEKLQKAVDLSDERYCGVSAMFKKAIKITHEIKILED